MHAGRVLFACLVPESSEVLSSSTKYLLHCKPRNRTFVFASPNPSKPVSQQSFELICARAITRILPVFLSSSVASASSRAYGCCPWVFARDGSLLHNANFLFGVGLIMRSLIGTPANQRHQNTCEMCSWLRSRCWNHLAGSNKIELSSRFMLACKGETIDMDCKIPRRVYMLS